MTISPTVRCMIAIGPGELERIALLPNHMVSSSAEKALKHRNCLFGGVALSYVSAGICLYSMYTGGYTAGGENLVSDVAIKTFVSISGMFTAQSGYALYQSVNMLCDTIEGGRLPPPFS